MNLINEYKEYKTIYNIYSDSLKETVKSAQENRKQIIVKDKEDIQAQNDSKEKQGMLVEYMIYIYKITLIQNDLQKIAERLLYINEASVRNNQDLELQEEDKKFMDSLSLNSSSTYAIENGKLTPKVKGLEDVIKKQVEERTDMSYTYMDAIRNSAEYKNA